MTNSTKDTIKKVKSITIEIKSIYGVFRAYPVCYDAELFASIAGTKTLTRDTLRLIKKLGYTIQNQVGTDCNDLIEMCI